jgi:acetolactate synthase-1/2/3 large subunit
MYGYQILARALRDKGVQHIFFLMGGPLTDCAAACEQEGIVMVDVRHEQAAAMMATAYARMRRGPAICMAGSGPGSANLVTGVANAWADGSPVIAIGGSAPLGELGRLSFQETDQVAMFTPITRWAERCYRAARIPEYVDRAFRKAFAFHPGPVYLDMPGDVLHEKVADSDIIWVNSVSQRVRPRADPEAIRIALNILDHAERPVVITGSGTLWSNADDALRTFVERSGIPFWSTPQGRGIIPEDHALSFLASRSAAFRECDVIIQVGTRQNYVIQYALPPRWNADAKLIQVDIDPEEIGRSRRADVPLAGDAGAVLSQLLEIGAPQLRSDRYGNWISYLRSINTQNMAKAELRLADDSKPIHPLRLCKEVRDWLPRDAVLVADGEEILTFARQSIPFFEPRSLNSGPYGCMGVGLPFAIGAKFALPDSTVVVLHGDGSFGMNAMELDTALRFHVPVICVISNNGGWTAKHGYTPGRDLGFTRYDLMFSQLGAFTRFVEDPSDLRAAFEDAHASNRPALINVVTDPNARAQTVAFTDYRT